MVFLIFLLSILSITDGVPFSHNVDFEHPESGERVKLQSTGQLTNAVDLDRIEGIKVRHFTGVLICFGGVCFALFVYFFCFFVFVFLFFFVFCFCFFCFFFFFVQQSEVNIVHSEYIIP